MSIYDTIIVLVKEELKKTPHGRQTLSGWSDAKIKTELKDPCFFGAKPEMRDKVKAVSHFKRISEINTKQRA